MSRKLVIPFYLLLVLVPLVLGVGYSLFYSTGLIGLLDQGFTLRHWDHLWSGEGALESIAYSLYIAVASLVVAVLPALGMSHWLSHHKRGSSFIGWLVPPLLLAPIIAAFVVQNVLAPTGLLARLLHAFGILKDLDGMPRMVNDTWSIGILVTHALLIAPLFTLLFLAIARKERLPRMREIAVGLGASGRTFLWRVHAPVILGRARPFLLLYGLFLFGAFEVPLLLGRSAPRSVSVFIFEKMTRFDLNDIAVGHAMAVVYTVLVAVMVLFAMRRGRLIPWMP